MLGLPRNTDFKEERVSAKEHSSVNTTMITVVQTHHLKERVAERDVSKRELQRAVKYALLSERALLCVSLPLSLPSLLVGFLLALLVTSSLLQVRHEGAAASRRDQALARRRRVRHDVRRPRRHHRDANRAARRARHHRAGRRA